MDITPLDNWVFSKTGADLEAYQTARLRETLTLAKSRSRFYRERLAGVDPASIKTPADINKLPFTTPDDISANPGDFVCAAPHEIERIVTLPTSGTTGRPKRIYNTAGDLELTVDFFHRGMSTLARPGDRVMIYLPGEAEGGVAALLREGLKRLGCEGIIYGPVFNYGDARNALSREKADCAVGLPSVMLALAGTPGDPVRLRSVLLCSDYASDSLILALTSQWGCDVFTHYGLTESGLGGGVECGALDGYHMREADLRFEIIEPVTGLAVPDGEHGELVFTTLTKRGMPLIRYRTGDRSRVIPEPCPCGSRLRRFERVSGRLPDSGLTINLLDDIIYALPGITGYTAEIVQSGLVITVTGPCALTDVEMALRRDSALHAINVEIRRGGRELLPSGINKRTIKMGADR